MEIRKLEGIIEAILFTMGGAVELSRIAKAVEEPEERIKEAVTSMQKRYEEEDSALLNWKIPARCAQNPRLMSI